MQQLCFLVFLWTPTSLSPQLRALEHLKPLCSLRNVAQTTPKPTTSWRTSSKNTPWLTRFLIIRKLHIMESFIVWLMMKILLKLQHSRRWVMRAWTWKALMPHLSLVKPQQTKSVFLVEVTEPLTFSF